MAPSKPLTLIVATTAHQGIGYNGALPWPTLKGEMGYFARVTKRVVPSSAPTDPPAQSPPKNAVIMGRKTWDSIPPRFRPLAGRINIVVSRSSPPATISTMQDTHWTTSLAAAVSLLQERHDSARIYVIGGASIYGDALKRADARSVLLTKINSPDFECDTFFPLDLEGGRPGWVRRGQTELSEFTGETFGEGEGEGVKRREGDVEYEFCLFERNGS